MVKKKKSYSVRRSYPIWDFSKPGVTCFSCGCCDGDKCRIWNITRPQKHVVCTCYTCF